MEEFQRLNIKAKKSWIISRFIWVAIVGISLIIGRFISIKSLKESNIFLKYFFYVSIGIFILLLINAIIHPIIEYKQWKYKITKDKVEYVQGIYFRKRVIIPVVRIQHIQLNQGIINRCLKLTDITFATAGGIHKIPNLDTEKAEEIANNLKEVINVKIKRNTDKTNILIDKEM